MTSCLKSDFLRILVSEQTSPDKHFWLTKRIASKGGFDAILWRNQKLLNRFFGRKGVKLFNMAAEWSALSDGLCVPIVWGSSWTWSHTVLFSPFRLIVPSCYCPMESTVSSFLNFCLNLFTHACTMLPIVFNQNGWTWVCVYVHQTLAFPSVDRMLWIEERTVSLLRREKCTALCLSTFWGSLGASDLWISSKANNYFQLWCLVWVREWFITKLRLFVVCRILYEPRLLTE